VYRRRGRELGSIGRLVARRKSLPHEELEASKTSRRIRSFAH
jgi:hypothetical protein